MTYHPESVGGRRDFSFLEAHVTGIDQKLRSSLLRSSLVPSAKQLSLILDIVSLKLAAAPMTRHRGTAGSRLDSTYKLRMPHPSSERM